MKNIRKLFCLIIVLALFTAAIPSTIATAYAANSFRDVSNKHWAYSSIMELSNKGIVNGMGNGIYQPEGNVTRGQFVKLLVGACGDIGSDSEKSSISNDVPSNNWVYPYLSKASAMEIVRVSDYPDGNFKPDQAIDRETAVIWMMRGLGLSGNSKSANRFSDIPVNNGEFYKALSTAMDGGLITGYEDKTFRPGNTLTRAESAVITKRVMDKADRYYSRGRNPEHINVDYSSNVTTLINNSATNKLVSYDENSGRYVFSNIDQNLSSMKVGDVFVINNSEDFPEGVAIKIASIKVDGNTATVTKADIALSDVFDDIDIYANKEITAANIDPASVPQGFTLVGVSSAEAYSSQSQIAERRDVPDSAVENNSSNVVAALYNTPDLYASSYSSDQSKLSYKVNYKADGLEVSGNIELKNLLNTSIEYHSGRLEAVDIWLDTETTSDLSISAAVDKEFKPIKIGQAKVPIASTGLFAVVDIYVRFSMDGSVTLSYQYKNVAQYGVQCSNGTILTYKNSDPSFSVETKLTGGCEVAFKVDAGVEFYAELLKADLYVEAGPRFEVTDSLLNKNSDDSSHNCFFCLDGGIDLNSTIGAEVDCVILGGPLETSNTAALGYWNFHVSESTQSDPIEFAWGKCENWSKVEPIQVEPVQEEEAHELLGIYDGTYTAPQGITGVTIEIYKTPENVTKAKFSLYPVLANPRLPEGEYLMDVALDSKTNAVILTSYEWVDQPIGWVFVDFKGILEDETFSGDVLSGSDNSTYEPGEKVGEFNLQKRAANDDKMAKLIGTYEGGYDDGHGEYPFELEVYQTNEGATEASFTFTSMSGSPGEFLMKAEYNYADQLYVLEAYEWVDRPSGYYYLDLSGKLDGDNFTGYIPHTISSIHGDFSLTKN